MRAAVYKGNQQFGIEELPRPAPRPGQVLVKVKHCAICGTDVHAFLYDAAPPGTVMGHEYCGTIEEIGPGVSAWNLGDRVVGGGGTPPPGTGATASTNPRYNFRTMGYDAGKRRAYAEYVLLDEWEPIPIPEGVSDQEAALCEPCAIAVHAVRMSDLRLGDTVAVLGAGPIGLLCLQAARAAGAGAVFVSEPARARSKAAAELGADAVFDPTKEDVVQQIVSATGGTGPQIVFDCAGAKPTLDQALNMVQRHGQVVLVALAWEQTSVLPVDWIGREVRLQCSFGSQPEDWRIALNLIEAGKISIEPMVSEADFVPLDQIQRAFEELTNPTVQLQMVVNPWGSGS